MSHHVRESPLDERRGEETVTLYVNNLPVELNEDGITQIFKCYGEVCCLYTPPNASWAYISYRTYREAEHAIRSLNGLPPLNLKVAFRKKEAKSRPEKYSMPPPNESTGDAREYSEYRYPQNGLAHNIESGRVVPGAFGINLAQIPSCSSPLNGTSVYPCDIDHSIFNPFETIGRYADTNAMWSRGRMTIDDFGKRYVSMGRGYTYNIPEPYPGHEQDIQRVFEKRRAGFYQHGKDSLQHVIGKCTYCAHIAKLRCARCEAFYCSRDCQIVDWSRHKIDCKIIPALIGDSEPTYGAEGTLSCSSAEDQFAYVAQRPRGMVEMSRISSLRRPKRVANLSKLKIPGKPEVPKNEIPIEESSEKKSPQKPEVEEKMSKENEIFPIIENSLNQKNSIKQLPVEKYWEKQNVDDPGEKKKEGYDENANDGNKENSRPDPFAPDHKSTFRQNYQSDRSNDNHSKSAIYGGTRDSMNNYKKIEQQLVFPGGTRDSTNDYKKIEQQLVFPGGTRDSTNNYKKIEQQLVFPGGTRDSTNNYKKIEQQLVFPGGTRDSTNDYKKIEEEIVFQRDPKIHVNVADNEASVRSDSIFKVATTPKEEKHEKIVKLSPVLISRETFEDVRVIIVMDDKTFWVNRRKDVTEIERMMIELMEKADKYPKATELLIGSSYAVKYEDMWHRASIITTKPSINILYDDFGNIEPPQSNDFRLLNDFTSYPAFALHLRLSPNSSSIVKPDDEISVKVSDIDEDGVVEVIVKEEIEKIEKIEKIEEISNVEKIMKKNIPEVGGISSLNETVNENDILKNTIDHLAIDTVNYAQVYMALDNNSYAVCVLSDKFMNEYQMIFESLTKICNSTRKRENWIPKIGDFLCGKRDEFWLRGYVHSLTTPIRLALVDEARISQVDEILPMPSECEKICSFGAICTLEAADVILNVDETPEFRVVAVDNEDEEIFVKIILMSPERLKGVRATLRRWKPTPEQKGVEFAELKSNAEVFITAYRSERIMYVRSLDNESLERTQRLLQNVAKWAQTAPKLSGPPAIGQLVIAKYSDGNFYRAIVTKLEGGKVGVSYIDYGNRDMTTIDNLRLLSDGLKNQKACMTKVILKDILNDVVPTLEVHRYLDILIGKEQPLICTFEGIPSKDGVELTMASGESVNERINFLLVPSWQREDPSKNTKCFMIDHLATANLGEIGHIVQAIVLFATDPPFKYVMSPFDPEHVTHVTAIMPELLQKYCEERKEHYIPRTDELCIAPYDGGWYRGACLNRNETPTAALIYFVDFGNIEIVNHTDIREMTKEFMSPSSLGISCIVKNLGVPLVNGKVPDKIQRRIDELIRPSDTVDVKIIKKTSPDEEINADYEVELPIVREKLIAEGLIEP